MTTMPCELCGGTGLVPRTGTPFLNVIAEAQQKETCSRCGGAGAVPYSPPRSLPEPAIDPGDTCI